MFTFAHVVGALCIVDGCYATCIPLMLVVYVLLMCVVVLYVLLCSPLMIPSHPLLAVRIVICSLLCLLLCSFVQSYK